MGVEGVEVEALQGFARVTKSFASRTCQEGQAIERDSRVGESEMTSGFDHLSTTWKVSHVGTRADHRLRLNTLGDR